MFFLRWKPSDIDTIIRAGAANHRQLREVDLFSTHWDGRVGLDDLPHTFVLTANGEGKSVMMVVDSFSGPVDILDDDPRKEDPDFKTYFPSLMDVLENRLKFYRPVVATIGEYSLLFTKVMDEIWLFDSHCRDEKGFPCSDGKFCLYSKLSIK